VSGWDRRDFLRLGAFGAPGLALDNKRRRLGAADKPWNAGIGRSLRKFRDPAPTVCRMCPAHCGVVAYRDGDRVVQVLGSPGAPNSQGGICSRAFAGLERLYDSERQLRPLRRKGPRGGGEWETISWAEALEELSPRLWAAGEKVLHLAQDELLVEDLRGTFGWSEILVDRPLAGRPGPGSGQSWYGAPVLGAFASRARTILLFGARPLDGRFQVPLARDIAKAREQGAAIHLFDSFEGSTGSLAEWHPVAPGTEAAVALGLARLLLHWEAFDVESFRAHVSDSPDDLRAALESYTPEAVQARAGVPAAALVSLARSVAEHPPALALAEADSEAAPAAALLNHLAGTVNRPGGVATTRGPFFLPALKPTSAPEAWLQRLASDRARPSLYWTVDVNPAYDAPDGDTVAAALADPDRAGFVVAMDTHLTETAQRADLFLPRTTHFESWALVEGCLPDGRPYLFLQQPVTQPAAEPEKLRDPNTPHLDLFGPAPRPLGEARSLPDVLAALAHERPPKPFPYADARAYLFEVLRKSWGPGSLEALARRGVWVSGESRPPAPAETVSLKGALRPLQASGSATAYHLVRYEPATLPRAYGNTRWGREISHACEAFLHTETGARLGVRDGDPVIIGAGGREVRVRARLLRGLHPAAVALPDGFGRWGGGSVARGERAAPVPPEKTGLVRRRDILNPLGLTSREVEPGEPIWWTHAGPGVSANALFPFRITEGGLQDWGPLPVTVRRA